MTELGAGIHLSDEFDFEVDESGDIRTISGSGELQKDIAFFLAYELERRVEDDDGNIERYSQRGRVLDNAALKRIEIVAEDTLVRDERVNTVTSLEARKVEENSNEVELVAEVDVDSSKQDLVIEVNV